MPAFPALRRVTRTLAAAALILSLPFPVAAQPDPRQMSGIPLPVGDLPAGSVSVRVIRGSLANPVIGQEVELVVGGDPRRATTAEAGRAEFSGLPPGSQVQAFTTLDGRRLESQSFAVPAAGGIRLMLVGDGEAGATASATPPAPVVSARAGVVTLGEQSRFVFEMGDEALTGFYILQVVNQGSTSVQPEQPVTVNLPEGATDPTILAGSSPQGTVADNRVRIAGPFPPGQTLVQAAFSLPYSGASLRVEQRLPVDLALTTTLIEKVGAMTFESPQVTQRREVTAQSDIFIVGQGPGVRAGEPLVFEFGGLPHAPLWPRNLAIGLAVAILAAGVWGSVRSGRRRVESRRVTLATTRDRLFAELTALEARQRAAATPSPRDASRRHELVSALERIYAELDDEAVA